MTPAQRELLSLIRDGRDPTTRRGDWPGRPGGHVVIAACVGNRLIEGDYGSFRLTPKGEQTLMREEDGGLI